MTNVCFFLIILDFICYVKLWQLRIEFSHTLLLPSVTFLSVTHFLVASSYSRSPSYLWEPRRRGSVSILSSGGSYSRYSTDRWTSIRCFWWEGWTSRDLLPMIECFTLLCLLPRLRDRRSSSSRETDAKRSRKSRKRRRRKSYSPLKKRRRDSPSHLEARRITR